MVYLWGAVFSMFGCLYYWWFNKITGKFSSYAKFIGFLDSFKVHFYKITPNLDLIFLFIVSFFCLGIIVGTVTLHFTSYYSTPEELSALSEFNNCSEKTNQSVSVLQHPLNEIEQKDHFVEEVSGNIDNKKPEESLYYVDPVIGNSLLIGVIVFHVVFYCLVAPK